MTSPSRRTMAAHPLDERPSVGSRPVFAPPDAVAFSLRNGARVWLVERHDLPLFSLRILVRGGSLVDPPRHPGLCALADTLLMHGAGQRDANAFAEAAESMALDLHAATWTGTTVLALDGHTGRLPDGLDLLADAVLRTRFDAGEIERQRDLRLGEIKRDLDEPASVAAKVARRVYYGQGSPRAHDPDGTTWGVLGPTAQELRAAWTSRSGADRAHFVVVGAVGQAELARLLEARFAGWGNAPLPLAPPPAVTPRPGTELVMVDNPGATQTVLRLLLPGPAAADASLQALRIGVIALGGTFTSRLNRRLREEKGYTYGVSARVQPLADHGLVVASTSVHADATGPALADLLAEIGRIREGIDDTEAAKARQAELTSVVSALDSLTSVAGTFAELVDRGLGPDALRLGLVEAGRVDGAAASRALGGLSPTGGVIVVLGDLDTIGEAVARAVPGDWRVEPREPPVP